MKSTENKILEISIPVLNEEKTLFQNVEKALDFLSGKNLENAGYSFRISIADNGSTDATLEEANKLLLKHPDSVRLVSVSRRGVGLALKRSWGTSNADIVGYMDLDLATDLSHISQVVDAMKNGADIAYGSRLSRGSKVVNRTL